MDPITIVTTVGTIVSAALKTINIVNEYHDRYSRAAITIASMRAQCSCVEFALLQVQDVVINNPRSAYRLCSDGPLMTHFMSVFGACQVVFAILAQRLNKLVDDKYGLYGEMAKMAKVKMMWNDQEMKDLLRNIESQASAMNLLLSALQMTSNAEVHNLLTTRESKRLLSKVTDDASSLKTEEDSRTTESKSRMDSMVVPSLHQSFDEIEFDFDFEIINTTTYRNAFKKASRQMLVQPQVGVIETVGVKAPDIPPLDDFLREWGNISNQFERNPPTVQATTSIFSEDLMDLSDGLTRADEDSETLTAVSEQESQTTIEASVDSLQKANADLIDITSLPEPSDPAPEPFMSNMSYGDLMELNITPISSNETLVGDSEPSEEKAIVLNSWFNEKNYVIPASDPHRLVLDLNNVKLSTAIVPFSNSDTPTHDFAALTSQSQLLGNTYALEGLIHDGTSSKVLLAQKKSTAEMLAIKVVNHTPLPNRTVREQISQIHLEVAILHDLSHYNIVRIHELIELDKQTVIVMAHASTSTLLQHIVKYRKGTVRWTFPEARTWSIFRQLISGIRYLHDNYTIHRDLTLDNLLYDETTGRIVIKGFSIAEIVSAHPMHAQKATALATYRSQPETQTLGSASKFRNPYFAAPELLSQSFNKSALQTDSSSIYGRGKLDVYSCGVILFALLSGVLPYNGNMLMTQFSWVHTQDHYQHVLRTPLSKVFTIAFRGDSFAEHLLTKMLDPEPLKRFEVRDVEKHPWLQACPNSEPVSTLVAGEGFDWAPDLLARLENMFN